MSERDAHNLRRGAQSNPHSGRYPRKRSRKRKRFPVLIKILIEAAGAAAVILYFYIAAGYKDTYLPNTVIRGVDVSGLDAEQAKSAIDSDIEQYTLTIYTRGGGEEAIHGYEIGLRAEDDGTLEAIMDGQNPLTWGWHCVKGNVYEVGIADKAGTVYDKSGVVSFDGEMLSLAVESLACMNPEQAVSPVDARLAYVEGTGYRIVPEAEGTELIEEKLYGEIARAVGNLEESMILDERDVYRNPGILQDDAALKAQAEALQPYAGIKIVYRFGTKTEVLDGSTIHQWLSAGDGGEVVLDEEKTAEYVKALAKKYNTAYRARELKTSYGPSVTITSGHYGWMIDQEEETKALAGIIRAHESQEREPVYAQKAASHDGPDYGDTYVEMNLTAQHMYFYKNGKLLVESDFVSGNEAKGWSTPAGSYELTYKQRNAVLKGKNYKTPVSYWMPFNGNIGMHDGYWRTSFGGTIYKKNGSHGCVNLPPAVAKKIYENIEAGIPVLCYHLDGTEKPSVTVDSGKNDKKNKAGAAAKPQETGAMAPETTVPEPAVTEPAAPGITAPGISAPASGAEVSEIPAPGTVSPETPGPETSLQETIALNPEAAVPETAAPMPETTAPKPVPETTVAAPGTAVPETIAPMPETVV